MVDLEGELIAIEAKSGPVHNRQGNYLWVKR